ncbi:MAG TPA: hypothetical protein VFQ47_01295 [Nitrososphaera sp.]|nr:hypothetical protein [Nitrososphaera sp.]
MHSETPINLPQSLLLMKKVEEEQEILFLPVDLGLIIGYSPSSRNRLFD